MFDNPQKELERLQAQLLAAEEEPEGAENAEESLPAVGPEEEIWTFRESSPGWEEPEEAEPPENRGKSSLNIWLVLAGILELSAALLIAAWWLLWRN